MKYWQFFIMMANFNGLFAYLANSPFDIIFIIMATIFVILSIMAFWGEPK